MTLIVPLWKQREAFFRKFVLPSYIANSPLEIRVVHDNHVERYRGRQYEEISPHALGPVTNPMAKRNLGAENVTTTFLMHCDDDVIMAADVLEKFIDAAENGSAAIAYCNYLGLCTGDWVHPQGRVFRHTAKTWNVRDLCEANYITSQSLIRTECAVNFDEDPAIASLSDWDLWLTMAESGFKGVWVNEELLHVYYIDHGLTAKVNHDDARTRVSAKHRQFMFKMLSA